MLQSAILTLTALSVQISLQAQWPVVELGRSAALPIGLCEPSISINRQNPQNLVAGVILDQVFHSNDGGKTWQRDTLTSPYGVYGDPVVISDYEGNQYYFHLSDPSGNNWGSEKFLDRIVCQKSSNGGKTWNEGTFMGLNPPKDQDKHWAVADPFTNRIHVTWTQFDKYGSTDSSDKSNIYYAYSKDGGETWTPGQRINQFAGNCLDSDQTTEGAVPAVGPQGQLYVAWAYNEKIYFDRLSSPEDTTWLPQDKIVAGQPGGWDISISGLDRANGMPVTVADVSFGPHRGTIYVNWVDKRRGNYDVYVSKSTDEGNTWSAPKRINNDTGKADQFFTWMACDPYTGFLYAVFYDRRHYPGSDSTEVFLAYSRDGGENWENEKISEAPFVPNDEIFMGDYNHIDAYQNRVRPVWTHYEKGTLSIKTALISVRP